MKIIPNTCNTIFLYFVFCLYILNLFLIYVLINLVHSLRLQVIEPRWRADVHAVRRPRFTGETARAFEVRGPRLGQRPREVTRGGPGAAVVGGSGLL
jgi:hypothetical protein